MKIANIFPTLRVGLFDDVIFSASESFRRSLTCLGDFEEIDSVSNSRCKDYPNSYVKVFASEEHRLNVWIWYSKKLQRFRECCRFLDGERSFVDKFDALFIDKEWSGRSSYGGFELISRIDHFKGQVALYTSNPLRSDLDRVRECGGNLVISKNDDIEFSRFMTNQIESKKVILES